MVKAEAKGVLKVKVEVIKAQEKAEVQQVDNQHKLLIPDGFKLAKNKNHEYLVDDLDNPIYSELVEYIQSNLSTVEQYFGSRYKYCIIDGYKYWLMPGFAKYSNGKRTIIINRATVT